MVLRTARSNLVCGFASRSSQHKHDSKGAANKRSPFCLALKLPLCIFRARRSPIRVIRCRIPSSDLAVSELAYFKTGKSVRDRARTQRAVSSGQRSDDDHGTTRAQNFLGATTALGYGGVLVCIGLMKSAKDLRFGLFLVTTGVIAGLIGARVRKKAKTDS